MTRAKIEKKIEQEYNKCLNLYSDNNFYLQQIVGYCFRAEAEHDVNIVADGDIYKDIENAMIEIEDDKKCIDTIYSMIINHVGESCVSDIEAAKPENGVLSKLTLEESFELINAILDGKGKNDSELLVMMRTLKWVQELFSA